MQQYVHNPLSLSLSFSLFLNLKNLKNSLSAQTWAIGPISADVLIPALDQSVTVSFDRVCLRETTFLPVGTKYFHATDPAFADYSICGHFDAWEPPDGPDALPEPWRTLAQAYNPKLDFVNCDANDFAGWVKRADKCCVLTGNDDLVECQHVVPQEHAGWVRVFQFAWLLLIASVRLFAMA